MSKMASVNILGCEILSCLGDLKQTTKLIKNSKIGISSKSIEANGKKVKIPYYLFEKEVKQNQKNVYALLRKIVQKVVKKLDKTKRKTTALLIGTSLIDWHLVDAVNSCAYEYRKTSYFSQKRSIDSYAKELSLEFGLSEFTMSINTACTSSANALLEAKNLINAGIVEYAVVIGLEIFSPVMSSGFHSMELISKTMPKPFDLDRDGLVLGEAVSGILLGKSKSNWSLEGGFSNCNSQTITSVGSSGEECVEVMQKALEDCSLHVEEITLLKAHATGSSSNDEAEMNAIKNLFDSSVVFTALKPYVGHTIGASGALEISIMINAVDNGFIPKTLFCKKPILKDYMPIDEHKECKSGIFMCNYFGFGGNNTSLIIKKTLS